MVLGISAILSAIVSLTIGISTYWLQKKRTLTEIRARNEEKLYIKRLEYHQYFWEQTFGLSSEFLDNMTTDEAKVLYDDLLDCYKTNGLYLTTSTRHQFQRMRKELQSFINIGADEELLDNLWLAKSDFRMGLKKDIYVIEMGPTGLERGWWKNPKLLEKDIKLNKYAYVVVDQLLSFQKKQKKDRFILSIAGYPSTGKTTIANRIQDILGDDKVVILGSECCIMSGDERAIQNISGCSPLAHDLQRYRNLIQSLINGNSIRVKQYSWETHSRSGPEITFELKDNSWLIVEGPIPCHPSIADLCDLVLFFKPLHSKTWLKNAIKRDITERHYSEVDAKKLNILKDKDMKQLLKLSKNNINNIIYVDYRENGKSRLEYVFDEFGAT